MLQIVIDRMHFLAETAYFQVFFSDLERVPSDEFILCELALLELLLDLIQVHFVLLDYLILGLQLFELNLCIIFERKP